MGQWVHRLSDIDAESRTATCANCGLVKIKRSRRKIGVSGWRCYVNLLAQRERSRRRRGVPTRSAKVGPGRGSVIYRMHKTDTCEVCGFQGHPCQLDVDHVDGDHSNNDPANLMTLCANCHRLKTWQERRKAPPNLTPV